MTSSCGINNEPNSMMMKFDFQNRFSTLASISMCLMRRNRSHLSPEYRTYFLVLSSSMLLGSSIRWFDDTQMCYWSCIARCSIAPIHFSREFNRLFRAEMIGLSGGVFSLTQFSLALCTLGRTYMYLKEWYFLEMLYCVTS